MLRLARPRCSALLLGRPHQPWWHLSSSSSSHRSNHLHARVAVHCRSLSGSLPLRLVQPVPRNSATRSMPTLIRRTSTLDSTEFHLRGTPGSLPEHAVTTRYQLPQWSGRSDRIAAWPHASPLRRCPQSHRLLTRTSPSRLGCNSQFGAPTRRALQPHSGTRAQAPLQPFQKVWMWHYLTVWHLPRDLPVV